MTAHIRLDEVKPGTFSSEKAVSFTVAGVRYSLLVDAEDVDQQNRLAVAVVDMTHGEAIIDLPRETFTSGPRLRIPRDQLILE
jgi:hypothetical protein